MKTLAVEDWSLAHWCCIFLTLRVSYLSHHVVNIGGCVRAVLALALPIRLLFS